MLHIRRHFQNYQIPHMNGAVHNLTTINGLTSWTLIYQNIRGMEIIFATSFWISRLVLTYRLPLFMSERLVREIRCFLNATRRDRTGSRTQNPTAKTSLSKLYVRMNQGFAKLCFVLAAVQLLPLRNLVSSSSVYVGRHAEGTISEQGSSESEVSEVNTCEDGSHKICRRIINLYGDRACTDIEDKNLQHTVQMVCQATCGFCTKDCEDQFKDLCKEYQNFCGREGDIGGLLAEICPKTCNKCQLRASSTENNVVVIEG